MRKTNHSNQRIASRVALICAPVLVAFALAACVPPDYPEDPRLSDESDLPEPDIIPMDTILNSARSASVDQDPAEDLHARGEDLRRRADDVRTAAPE